MLIFPPRTRKIKLRMSSKSCGGRAAATSSPRLGTVSCSPQSTTHPASVSGTTLNDTSTDQEEETFSAEDFDLPLFNEDLVTTEISHAAGDSEVQQPGKRADITWTFLYHFGVLTRSSCELRKYGYSHKVAISNENARRAVCSVS